MKPMYNERAGVGEEHSIKKSCGMRSVYSTPRVISQSENPLVVSSDMAWRSFPEAGMAG